MIVNLEITGFYYREKIDVPCSGPFVSVKALMEEAVKKTTFPKLQFTSETLGKKEFLDTIIVEHDDTSAKSGQTIGSANPRLYPAGIYLANDDPVFFGSVNGVRRLVSPEGKKIISAWQYYVYDKNGVDLNRTSGPRRVVPFADDFTIESGTPPTETKRGLEPDDTVVWRRVSICVEPTNTGVSLF